jgi:hypothetical protein
MAERFCYAFIRANSRETQPTEFALAKSRPPFNNNNPLVRG